MEKEFEGMLAFAVKLIREPSPTLGEGAVAELVEQEMQRIGYDDVRRDEVGNVLGIIEGRGEGPTVMLNGHMDHVEVTDADKWQHGPFEARIDGGFLHGRGADDMKASLAVMVHCGALSKRYVPELAGRVVTAAVVLEETAAGIGTRHILNKLRPDMAIVGEPTGNRLVIGHRGRGEIVVVVRGKSCHASMPDKGVSPLLAMAEFIKRVSNLKMSGDEMLGEATLVPTIVRTDQPCSNVVPSEVTLWLDCRCVLGQKRDELLKELKTILNKCLTEGTRGEVSLAEFSGQCYTGKRVQADCWSGCFKIGPEKKLVQIAQKALSEALGRDVEPSVVRFCSDAAVLAEYGVETILFGPGEPSMAHVRDERIELAQMREAAKGLMKVLGSLLQKEA